ncbi:MAG TPA: hypothetical protein VGG74_04040 [Kofleriaceae bacterium]
MGDERAARIAATTSEDDKYALIQALRPPFSDELLAVLADALADERRVLISPGWYDDRDSVSNAARIALERAGEVIEPFVAAKLGHPEREVVGRALRLLGRLPSLAPATLDAILRHAGDRELGFVVGETLRGKLDARPLLDFPETRLAGLVATPDLEPALLTVLLGDADAEVRLRTLHKIVDRVPPLHELVPVILPLLVDPDPIVSACAVRTLAPLRPDDTSVTAAMFEASRRHHDVFDALAKRPAAHLVPYVPELMDRMHRERAAAIVIAALGSTAPTSVALALGQELLRGEAYAYLSLIDVLDKLGMAALPACSLVERASRELDNPDARVAAAQLAERLRALASWRRS